MKNIFMPKKFKAGPVHLKRRIAVAFALAVLLAVYFFLSAIVTYIVNEKIKRMGEYRGHVKSVSLDIWRGAYAIDNLVIKKKGSEAPRPFLTVKRVDFNVQWKALMHGRIAGDIAFHEPSLTFIKSKDPDVEQTKFDYGKLIKRIEELSPLAVNRVLIHNGSLHFKDLEADPVIDVYAQSIEAEARNLTNIRDKTKMLKSAVEANGRIMNRGHFSVGIAFEPLAEYPTFETKNHLLVALPELNDFMKYYLAVEARGGVLEVFVEGAAAEGSFKGYAKPFMGNIDVEKLDTEAQNPAELLKGGAVQLTTFLFKNREKNDVATKVDFEGTFQNPDTDIIGAVMNFFKNAFTDAILPSFEASAQVTPAGELVNEDGKPVETESSEE